MNALVWEAARVMNLRQQEKPTLKPDEVLLKVSYAGICGSELSGYLGHNALRKPPLVMGHEFSATVAELGENATVENSSLQLGAQVTVNPLISCGNCAYCKQNLQQLCTTRAVLGAHRAGAYADFVAVPANTVHLLPENLSLRAAALTEPTAVAVRIANLLGPIEGETVLIAGAGPIGLLTLQVLRLRNVKVFISDLNHDRRVMALHFGGMVLDPNETDVVEEVRRATSGFGVLASIDAVGVTATRKQCVSATRSSGMVVLSGLHEEVGPVPAGEMIRREITVRGSFAYSHSDFDEAMELLTNGDITLDPWMVESPLHEGGAWFDRLVNGDGTAAKILLVP